MKSKKILMLAASALLLASCGGGGGGRPEMATGQVKSSGGFVEAVESLKENF